MDDYNRQANDLRLGVTQTAGAEQQRMMDMAAQRAGFENSAQQQQYQQLLASGTFSNQAQKDLFQQQAARGEFQNAGLAQQLAQQQTAFNAQNMARNQYMSEQYALRNQPINEISALISGSQINNPNFVNTPNNQIPTTDVAGLINNRFSQDMDIYKQESANQNALMGGIFGLAGGLLKGGMGMMSDEREKENISKIGNVLATNPDKEIGETREEPKELPIYEYSYKHDPASTRHVGPMAQDVEKIDKRAVFERKGVKYIKPDRVMGSILKVA